MRLAILLTALILGGAAKASDLACEFDLVAVREAALSAGPVRMVEHFTTYDDGATGRSALIVIDVIRPDRLRRIMMFENGNVGHMVLIAGSGWSGNIDGKWEPLNAAFSTKMLEAVMKNSPWPATSTQATCEPATGSDGEATLKFSFATTSGEQSTTHEVLADRETKTPVRYRARTTMKGVPYSESDRAFRFISSLEIEAPK